jgi:hypothetical protein
MPHCRPAAGFGSIGPFALRLIVLALHYQHRAEAATATSA